MSTNLVGDLRNHAQQTPTRRKLHGKKNTKMTNTWTTIKILKTQAAYAELRSTAMCCAVNYHKEYRDFCSVCSGDHTMSERLVRCSSETCNATGACAVLWKVHHCYAFDMWKVKVNEKPHLRVVVPCFGDLKPSVTKEIKSFIADQDDMDAAAKYIASRITKQPGVEAPSRQCLKAHAEVTSRALAHHK